MTFLLDANVLIALAVLEHEHHDAASEWLAGVESVAVHPVVEGALVRHLLRTGESAATARDLVDSIRSAPRTTFWADGPSYADVDLTGVTGHRQVTDVYLAAVAAAHRGRLATFDASIAALRPDSTLLIASSPTSRSAPSRTRIQLRR